jgi:hypothetical protein
MIRGPPVRLLSYRTTWEGTTTTMTTETLFTDEAQVYDPHMVRSDVAPLETTIADGSAFGHTP